MNSTTYAPLALPESAPPAARTVFHLMRRLRHGTLDVQMPDGSAAHFGTLAEGEPRAAIRLRNWAVCAAALRSGDIGVAETFIEGDWTTPDLAALLKLFIANRDEIEGVIYGSWWGSLLYRVRHLLHRNSKRGSKKNIHAHYDLGNEFYRLWLDETMNYSSAWFDGDCTRPMGEAQTAKVRRALSEALGAPDSTGTATPRTPPRVLEIGCGWGALAEVGARDFGAHVTGVTLSTEQLAWANDRLARAGLADRTDLRFQDYRELTGSDCDGRYDAVLSIEMFEAVGREYWGQYFDTVYRCLKPGGRACIQSITIRDDLFERYTRSTDFIQQYIFPGGLLPSVAAFHAEAERAGLRVVRSFAFGTDYAETLRRWRDRFLSEERRVHTLGFDTRFMRIWEFYLAYCEAAFATGNTDVVQFTLERPAAAAA